MIDEEPELRERFALLRAEERSITTPFGLRPSRKRLAIWRPIAATAGILLAVIIIVTSRAHTEPFSDSDRAAAAAVAAWEPPTDFLLHTPGSEMLATTPRIPDLKGIPR